MADNDKDNLAQDAPDVSRDAGARRRTDAETAAAADASAGVPRGQSETGDNPPPGTTPDATAHITADADATADMIADSGSPQAAETTAQRDLLSAAPSNGTGISGSVHADEPKRPRWPQISRLFSRSTWRGK